MSLLVITNLWPPFDSSDIAYHPVVYYHAIEGPSKYIYAVDGPTQQIHVITGSH